MTDSASALTGIWPPVLLPWTSTWSLDVRSFDANLDRVLAGEPHGVYTLDAASEFFTLEIADWRRVARRFVSRCQGTRCRIGLGCSWTNLSGAIRRMQEARDLGVTVVHISPPEWLPLGETGLRTFLDHVQGAAGHLRVVLYTLPGTKLRLTPELYGTLVGHAPCLAGTKSMGDDAMAMRRLHRVASGHCHYVHECYLVDRARLGPTGCCSALSGISLRFMTTWWAQIEDRNWKAARQRQARVRALYEEAIVPLRARGIVAGAVDKVMARVGGACGSHEVRPPYPSGSSADIRAVSASAHRLLPEMFEY